MWLLGGRPVRAFRPQASVDVETTATHSLVSSPAWLLSSVPAVFVFENVEGFLTAEGGSRVIELLEP